MACRVRVLWTCCLAAAAVACTCLLCGCGDAPVATARTSPANQQTPHQVVAKMTAALKDNDADSFLECFQWSDASEKQLVTAVFHFFRAMGTFQDTLVAVYGEDALEQYEKATGKMGEPCFGWAGPTVEWQAWADSAEYKLDPGGDKAKFDDGRESALLLSRAEGVWRVDLAVLLAPEGEVGPTTRFYETMARALEDASAEARKPGVTIVQLKVRLGKAFMGLLTDQPGESPGTAAN